MIKPLLAGVGGFAGSLARYLAGNAITRLMSFPAFPVATTAVNLVGCLSIGVLAGVAEVHEVFSESTRVFLFIGLLGGFTTFSTFGYESVQLVRDGRIAIAAANVAAQLILGLSAVWAGLKLARAI